MTSAALAKAGAIVAGRYRVLSELARGGFGVVYVAEQIATEKRVALKMLWPHLLQAGGARDNFQLEARVASRVASEHIVQVFDAGVDEASEAPFLVMELLEGTDLQRTVERDGPLPPALVLTYLEQVARGLDKAHGHIDREGRPSPIVHRDLKPENLFLTFREDGSPLVKILDFGIAKILSQSSEVSRDLKGTPLYMAYEQATDGTVTPATDIWALGLITFFLLTGRSFWRAANSQEGNLSQLFGEVLTLPIPPPSARARDLAVVLPDPPAFDAWFRRCVAREPKERFSSASDAVRALRSVVLAEAPPLSATVAAARSESEPRGGAALLEATRPRSRKRGALFAIAGFTTFGGLFLLWAEHRRPQVAAVPEPGTSGTDTASPRAPLPSTAMVGPSIAPVVSAASPSAPDAAAGGAAAVARDAPPRGTRPSPSKPRPPKSKAGGGKPDLYGDR